MTYETAEKLKKAKFPFIWNYEPQALAFREYPSLSELIEACGATTKNNPWGDEVGAFEFCLQFSENEWKAGYTDPNYHENWNDREEGDTPEEAVANLFLRLNDKK